KIGRKEAQVCPSFAPIDARLSGPIKPALRVVREPSARGYKRGESNEGRRSENQDPADLAVVRDDADRSTACLCPKRKWRRASRTLRSARDSRRHRDRWVGRASLWAGEYRHQRQSYRVGQNRRRAFSREERGGESERKRSAAA